MLTIELKRASLSDASHMGNPMFHQWNRDYSYAISSAHSNRWEKHVLVFYCSSRQSTAQQPNNSPSPSAQGFALFPKQDRFAYNFPGTKPPDTAGDFWEQQL